MSMSISEYFEEKEQQKRDLQNKYVGKTIVIHDMQGEPDYAGRTGVCTRIDDMCQLHGTWGGCALVESDSFSVRES